MAKLKAPLMSLGASGQLGKALVFFPWKGLDCVREYVIPANPDTTLQQTQRGYLRTLVAAIHTTQSAAVFPLVSADQVAYSALASARGKIMTWFNMAVKLGLDAITLLDGWMIYHGGHMVDTDKGDFRPQVLFDDDTAKQCLNGKFYLGTTKTNLIASIVGVIDTGLSVSVGAGDGFDGLTAKKKYYWQFRPDIDDPCEGSDSGIYFAYAT